MMEEFKVVDVLKKIEKYEIDKNNWQNYFLKNKDRGEYFSFFYYKSSLLQVLDCMNHLDKLIVCYFDENNECNISDKIVQSYHDLIYGDSEILKKVFGYVLECVDGFSKFGGNILINDVEIIFEKIYNVANERKICVEKLSEEETILKEGETDYKNWNNQFLIKKLNEIKVGKEIKNKCIDELEKIQLLKNKIIDYEMEIGSLRIEVEALFRIVGASGLYEKISFDDNYLEYFDRFIKYKNIFNYYNLLVDDVISSTKLIKNYSKLIKVVQMEKDLNKVCLMINKLLFSLYGDELKFSLESDVAFDDLCIQFRESLFEEDMDNFIRKCADFYFDFLKVHPFGKENDKISMVLLTVMLATRNIMLPILYNDTYEKNEFFVNYDIFVSNDYSIIEQYLFEKLSCYYPSVIPPTSKIKKYSKEK